MYKENKKTFPLLRNCRFLAGFTRAPAPHNCGAVQGCTTHNPAGKKVTDIKQRSFTLIELMVVVIIVGILAGIALPQYVRSRERTMDKQAKAILSLIRAAERAYKMETGGYYTGSGISNINTYLNLDLVDDGNWVGHTITSAAGFTATITRAGVAGGYPRSCWITAGEVNATCSNPP